MNNVSDPSGMDSLIARDNWLPHITEAATGEAMKGYALPLEEGLDFAWLSLAIRRSLAVATVPHDRGPDRVPNRVVRAELRDLSDVVSAAWQRVFDRRIESDSLISEVAFARWDGAEGIVLPNGLCIGQPSEEVRFHAAVREMDWLAGFLRIVADSTPPQKGSWVSAERRQLRVMRGQFLAPVFELAFGHPVSANNYPSDSRHDSPTPFMDFYQRAVALAFAERATPDLSGVLKLACKAHRTDPVQFNEGLIPGL